MPMPTYLSSRLYIVTENKIFQQRVHDYPVIIYP